MLSLASTSKVNNAPRTWQVPVPPKPENPVPPNAGGDGGKTPFVQWKGSGATSYRAYYVDYVVNEIGSTPEPSWYWGTQMWFEGGQVFYMGVQPNFGKRNMAIFSVFGENTKALADTCYTGADGGAGTSCSVQYDWVVGKTYRIIVQKAATDADSTVWKGVVVDLSTKRRTQIGKWSVPTSQGLIKPAAMTWAEWFSGNIPCSERTKSGAFFRYPAGKDAAGKWYRESLDNVSEGTCAGFTPVPGWVLTQAGG
jgi:hypothetical protein